VVVFLLAVTDSEDVGHPPRADVVEYRDVLGQSGGIVERQGDRQVEQQRLRPRRNGRRQQQRRGQVAVIGAVVLAQQRGDAAACLAHADISLAAAYRSDVASPGACERMSKRSVNIDLNVQGPRVPVSTVRRVEQPRLAATSTLSFAGMQPGG
jgi:hypothetical protein